MGSAREPSYTRMAAGGGTLGTRRVSVGCGVSWIVISAVLVSVAVAAVVTDATRGIGASVSVACPVAVAVGVILAFAIGGLGEARSVTLGS